MFSISNHFRRFGFINWLWRSNDLSIVKIGPVTSVKTISSQPKKHDQSAGLNEDILYKKIELEARSADRGVLDSYEKFVLMTANFLDIPVSRTYLFFILNSQSYKLNVKFFFNSQMGAISFD